MRVVFLSSAYFCYVHVYAFDPESIDDSVYAAADRARHARRTAVVDTAAQPTPTTGATWIEQLATWLSGNKRDATC